MQVSKNGIDYFLVNGGTEIIDSLPNKVFEVKYAKMVGTWLSEHKELTVDFKIYGKTPERVKKIFHTFDLRNKNLGVLLSGEKGMGKSVFMRHMAEQSIQRGLPVIIIHTNTPGIADFISKIDQECVILFDEFEKNFTKGDDCDDDSVPSDACESGQNQFLSLFDGMDSGKKIFVIAVNNSHRLSSFFINRPGRFYYHFCFDYLSESEVREYANDMLKGDKAVIDKMVLIARFHDISYDILSAIITELNNGYSLNETINDLNIDIDESSQYYDFEILVDGITLAGSSWIYRERNQDFAYVDLAVGKSFRGNANVRVFFDINAMEYDKVNGCVITKNGIKEIRIMEPFGNYKNCDSADVDTLSSKIDVMKVRPHEFGNSNGLSYLL